MGDNGRMLLDCEHCGAPLDVKGGAWVVTCAYCQRTQRVKGKTQAVPTPQDWRAPVQWTPPPAARVHGVVLHFDPMAAARHTSRRLAFGILIPILLFTAIGLAPVLVPLIRQNVALFKWDGKETFVCDGNGQKTIDGVKVKSSARPAISVRGNCQLTITSSRIRGDELFEIGENGRVTVKDSELTMQRTLSVDGNFGIKLVNSKLRIESEDKTLVALEANGNASVVLEETELTIQAGKDAVLVLAAGGGNGQVEIEKGKVSITGASRLVLARGHRPLQWHGGSLDAGGRALEIDGPYDVEGVELHGSKLVTEGEAGAPSTTPASTDDICARALRCCHKVLGPARCKHHENMPPAGCPETLRAYREAGQATGVHCD